MNTHPGPESQYFITFFFITDSMFVPENGFNPSLIFSKTRDCSNSKVLHFKSSWPVPQILDCIFQEKRSSLLTRSVSNLVTKLYNNYAYLKIISSTVKVQA